FAKIFLSVANDPPAGALLSVCHNLQYNGSLKCSAFNRRAASSRTGFVMGVLDDLTRKLDLRQTEAKGAAWAQRTRALVKDGKTWEPAMLSATDAKSPRPQPCKKGNRATKSRCQMIESLC